MEVGVVSWRKQFQNQALKKAQSRRLGIGFETALWPDRVGKSDFVSCAMRSTQHDFFRKAKVVAEPWYVGFWLGSAAKLCRC
jgi:hypothetical protein